MPVLTYEPEGYMSSVEGEPTILEASLAVGLRIPNQCGATGRCSTCRVRILRGEENCSAPGPAEVLIAAQLGLPGDVRLACQARVHGPVTLKRLVFDWEEEAMAEDPVPETEACPACGEKRLAILFADIRGFTAFAECLPPYDVVHVLNRYFHHMGAVITAQRGHISNYMGDGLLAVFGLRGSEGSALQAVRAGLGMLETMDRLKPYLLAHFGQTFDIGIGLHWGEAVVGNVGFDDQRRLTIIGDAVNYASRVEERNRALGTRFLVSEELLAELDGEVHARSMGPQTLKGKSGAHCVYEVEGLSAAYAPAGGALLPA